ncbi:Protein hhl1, chloroplastic [Dionaea muscipula]
MEGVGMSLKVNALAAWHPLKLNEEILSSSSSRHHISHSLLSSSSGLKTCPIPQNQRGRRLGFVVEAKGKKPMVTRRFQRPPAPSLPKIKDDGNPKFVIFIRSAEVMLWFPLTLVTGGTTAKIMVAAKDSFLGKYIYKDTLARNLAAVIYRVSSFHGHYVSAYFKI